MLQQQALRKQLSISLC